MPKVCPATRVNAGRFTAQHCTFKDPDTGEVLGHEVVYLGDAAVEKFDTLTTLKITNAVLEINKGDRFAQATTGFASNYQPRAPEKKINAKVISIYGGVLQAGQNAVVTLNKGSRDGLENGHVLALYQKGEVLPSNSLFKSNTVLAGRSLRSVVRFPRI